MLRCAWNAATLPRIASHSRGCHALNRLKQLVQPEAIPIHHPQITYLSMCPSTRISFWAPAAASVELVLGFRQPPPRGRKRFMAQPRASILEAVHIEAITEERRRQTLT